MFALLQPFVSYLRSRTAANERGAILVEYGLLVGLIAIVCLTAISFLGVNLFGFLLNAAQKIG